MTNGTYERQNISDKEDPQTHQKGEVASSCMVASHQSLPLLLVRTNATIHLNIVFSQLTFGNEKPLILILMVYGVTMTIMEDQEKTI